MEETRGTEPRERPARTKTPLGGRGILIGLVAVVIAFFVGFFWQFYQATTVRQTLAQTEQELVVERLRVQLANAAIAAQGGRYEAARREMSDFFNRAQTQRWALPDRLVTVTDEFLAMRDDVITGLSRGNPEYADVLYGMLDRFDDAIPPVGAPRDTAPPADATPRDPPGTP